MKFLASHESSTRGTFDFPIELYYVDKMHPRYEMPFHWHMEFELMLVLSGEFSLTFYTREMPPSFQPGPFTAEPPTTAFTSVLSLI